MPAKLTKLQLQHGRLLDARTPQHLHADGHVFARVGGQEGEEVAGGFAGAGVEGGEGRGDGGEVFGEHCYSHGT